MTLYEQAEKHARFHLIQSHWAEWDYEPPEIHVQRMQKQIFAKWIVKGATIGKANGKLIVHKQRIVRRLPH